ncbi:MAG: tannase/feruloyl esterase family alpha/beta hydrolase [Rhodobacteraceae bacterium]|nr:tannase/feruloyl esterase family alpha/beta hydrolase [Paracoccaceae bacterium]
MTAKTWTGLGALATVVILSASHANAASLAPAQCTALTSGAFTADVGAETSIQSAEIVSAGNGKPAHCRVLANIAPSIGVEVRLPMDQWSGRFLFTGCGGLCGVINSVAGDDALMRGYAVATTDMGHRIPASGDQRGWTKDRQLVVDWLHRSTHLATVLAKAVIAQAYGTTQDHAFYRGCSTGGRQGLTEALMYPDDFDGIIAGAPAANMVTPHGVYSYASNTRSDGSPILTADALRLLAGAALQSCDMDDGVKDGVLGDPQSCSFDPAALACKPGVNDGCLTAEQIATAEKIYSGAVKADGTPFYPIGYAKGSELGWIRGLVGENGRPAGRAGSSQFAIETLIGPDATLADFDYAKHGTTGGPVGGVLDYGPDGRALATFKDRGGKILIYHGWSDTDATPASSLDFYEHHDAAFGTDALTKFVRVFMMPGMTHCRGGPGVDTADYLTAIEQWVEQDKAPDQLDAYRTTAPPESYRPFPLDESSIVARRTIYPYPANAVYDGKAWRTK